MKLYLYKVNDAINTINKVKTNEKMFDITLKETSNIVNPIIKLDSVDSLLDYNYCYIPDFKRYYFISDINIKNNTFYIINLKCDVLESFKSDILLSNGLIVRKSNPNNFYDSEYHQEIKKEYLKYDSDVTLEMEENILIVAIGGVD